MEKVTRRRRIKSTRGVAILNRSSRKKHTKTVRLESKFSGKYLEVNT